MKILLIQFAVCCSLLFSDVVHAQWVPLYGPENVKVYSLAASGTNIYAGTDNGIFMSSNSGASWDTMGFSGSVVYDVTISGSYLYAAPEFSGLYRTSNNGKTWDSIMYDPIIYGVAFSGDDVFIATYDDYVFRSTDNGTTWTDLTNGLPYPYFTSIAISAGNIYAGTEAYGRTSAGEGVFLSTDNGDSWTAVNNGLTDLSIPSLAVSGTNVFAGTGNLAYATGAGAFVSTDKGADWSQTSLSSYLVSALAVFDGDIFAATGAASSGSIGHGVFFSSDNGMHWTSTDSGLVDTNVTSLAVSSTNLYCGTAKAGVWRYNRSGVTGIHPVISIPDDNITISGEMYGNKDSVTIENTGYGELIVNRIIATDNSLSIFNQNSMLFILMQDSIPVGGSAKIYIVDNSSVAQSGTAYVIVSSNDPAHPQDTITVTFIPQQQDTTGVGWVQMNGPYGGFILDLATIGNNVFASASQEHVYRSSDFGTTWIDVGRPLGGIGGPYKFAENGGSLYAAMLGEVAISSDNGATWSITRNGLPGGSLGPFAFSGNAVFTSALYDGVFVSTNNGADWTQMNNGLTSLNIWAMAGIGGTVYAGTDSGMFSTADNGAHWHPANSGLTNFYPVIMTVDGSTIYAASIPGKVVRSTDNGASWTEIDHGMLNSLGAMSAKGNDLFIASGSGFFHSTDGGSSWKFNQFLSFITGDEALSVTQFGGYVYAGTTVGLIRSSDDGTSWEYADSGIFSPNIGGFATAGNELYCGAIGGAYFSTDKGANWSACGAGLPNVGAGLSVVGNNVFAATDKGVYNSTDNGAHWAKDNALPNNTNISWLMFNAGSMFAVTPSALFISTDNGASWNRAPLNPSVDSININTIVANGNNIYVGTDSFGVYGSNDNGKTWKTLNNGLTGLFYVGVALNGNELFANTQTGTFISTDNGTTWTQTGTSQFFTYSVGFAGGDVFAMIGGFGNMSVSTDNGAHWNNAAQGFTAAALDYEQYLFVNNDYIYCSTDGYGVWRRPLSDFGITPVKENPKALPSQLALAQNYPNPFNATTMIEYALPQSSYVKLNVYNALGEEVAVLVDGEQNVGSHSIAFHGENLQNGIYYYRLAAGAFSQSGKMIVVK